MFHVAGLNCQLVMATAYRHAHGLPAAGPLAGGRPPADSQSSHRATAWSLVPTQLWRLLEWPDLDQLRPLLAAVASVAAARCGPPELLRSAGGEAPLGPPRLGIGYGMTETNGLGTSLAGPETTSPSRLDRRRLRPRSRSQVRDPGTAGAVADGAVGEICLRCAALFSATGTTRRHRRSALDEERWYHTGDYGHISTALSTWKAGARI